MRQGSTKEDFLNAAYSYIDFSYFSCHSRFSIGNAKLTSNL